VEAAPDLVVTASFGIACLDSDTACFEALLAAADEALYEAKATGRNRTAFRSARASRKAA
jgi:diguanylate cyclase (GGDEF)-like protein